MYGSHTSVGGRTVARRSWAELPGRSDDLGQLRRLLDSREGVQRQRARMALVDRGAPAVPMLIDLLLDGTRRERWEAAKALAELRDPLAAPALVRALMDDDVEVRWLAAEGLIAINSSSLIPLLERLEKDFDSIPLLQGTHHVLHALEREQKLSPSVQIVLDEIRSVEPDERVPWVARAALSELNNSMHSPGASFHRKSIRHC